MHIYKTPFCKSGQIFGYKFLQTIFSLHVCTHYYSKFQCGWSLIKAPSIGFLLPVTTLAVGVIIFKFSNPVILSSDLLFIFVTKDFITTKFHSYTGIDVIFMMHFMA